ncbi:unnamed protein product [Spirodela intermedia]|uniref:Uncharacterized protein n=1 Tax=Spirodela intermedia TaxID=51605 RepID=A0A7I8IKI5_SPIIN|nr:unnamed protein product [Spirodela intermedia]CAA6658389.1 unnamed protein product [Spirodela intermedia]
MASPDIHSGARYLAMPKSATLGMNSPSRRMFSGLMSQWMMQSRHLSCR